MLVVLANQNTNFKIWGVTLSIKVDKCVYEKLDDSDWVIICFYVDNMLITENEAFS